MGALGSLYTLLSVDIVKVFLSGHLTNACKGGNHTHILVCVHRNGKMSHEHIVNNVYQYNHHRGSLHLPVQGFAQNTPIALQVTLHSQLSEMYTDTIQVAVLAMHHVLLTHNCRSSHRLLLANSPCVNKITPLSLCRRLRQSIDLSLLLSKYRCSWPANMCLLRSWLAMTVTKQS